MKGIVKSLFLTVSILLTGVIYSQTAPCPTPPILNNPTGPVCTDQLDPCLCSQDFYWDPNIIPGQPQTDWWEVFRRTKVGTVWTPFVLVGKTQDTRWWVAWDAGDSSRSQDDGLQRAGQQKSGFIYEYKVRSCRYVPDWQIICSATTGTVATYKGIVYIRSVR